MVAESNGFSSIGVAGVVVVVDVVVVVVVENLFVFNDPNEGASLLRVGKKGFEFENFDFPAP